MTGFLLISAAGAAAGLVFLLSTRTVFSVSFENTRLFFSATILGCGLCYDASGHRPGFVCGRFVRYIILKSRARRTRPAAKARPVAKRRRKLSAGAYIRIGRAVMVFAARVLSCVVYKEANLAARPVIANPALAGMAFGWGQALYGAFPGLQTVLAVSPAFAPGQSTVSGHLTLSIKNRQVVYPTYRLLRQLPIKEIIRVRVFGRGG